MKREKLSNIYSWIGAFLFTTPSLCMLIVSLQHTEATNNLAVFLFILSSIFFNAIISMWVIDNFMRN